MVDWQETGPLSRMLRADNPGPMTLDGTNSYVLAAPGSATVVVVDPGPLLEEHLGALAGAGDVELILITHHHEDHTGGSARLRELTGAPVRAAHPDFCQGGEPLRDGELIRAAGVDIEVLATPGHTSDSVCFVLTDPAMMDAALKEPSLTDDAGTSQVLTGDTVLGQGTTVLDYPDGRLGDYLDSLEKLRALGAGNDGGRTAAGRAASGQDAGSQFADTQAGERQAAEILGAPVAVLPGHGPVLPDLAKIAAAYLAHRRERLAQVSAAVVLLERDGTAATAGAVTAVVYADVPANLQGAARLSVEAQLDYLRGPTSGR